MATRQHATEINVSDPSFVHLHLHTHYSLLDGATRIKPMIKKAKDMNMPAVAITDHGNMFGAVEFYAAAVDAGVKPIIGCETYMAPGDRRDKQASRMKEASYHLLLLAQNLEGYHNLLKLCSIGYVEGFYYKPRIDKETLREHSAGLICTSTCLGAEIPQALMNHNRKVANEVAETYLDIFGPDRFFIELQDHGIEEQRSINPELLDMADRFGVAAIATNDIHYLEKDDANAHDVLCCISTRKLQSDEDRLKFPSNEFYFKSPEEMAKLFPNRLDALANTVRIADMCDLELDFKTRHSPVYKLPEGKTEDQSLRDLVYDGARRKYGEITDDITERIDYELGVISNKGFSGYFLIVWDFMNYARSNGIPCGARGSGCSSVVSYCLDISAPDPLRYGLYFERFMDPDRDEMPDIDVDICQLHRADVIDYVRQKYGHVAQIITFGTLKARQAVKDVSRVLGLGFAEATELTNLIPNELKMTIEKALDVEPELKTRYENDPSVKQIVDIAKRLEGLARHAGVHAAGIVVADSPLDNFLPLYKPPSDPQIVTQFDGPTVERVGLLKFDFLGLRTLTTLERARQLAQKSTGKKIDVDNLDLTDQKVYSLFARGDTKGIFQFESGGMRDVLLRMKPNRIEDLIAANALFRPGPMQYIDAYVSRKHGEAWTTPHPIMTEVLDETYGIMVYQEQVSRMVNRLGKIELKRAFRLAKAISKKKEAMIEAEREPFLKGCEENGVSREVGNEVFEDILKFGSYAFNKAHSTGYALVAYQTAWMKVYHPVEFMAAVMTFEMSSTDKIVEYMDECRRLGIQVLPPDVNSSGNEFTVDTVEREGNKQKVIRFGLGAIKGVGEKAVNAVCNAREEGGDFANIYEFCERVDLSACNRSVVESLICCGAFDTTGAMRKALYTVLDAAIENGSKKQRDKLAGQMGLFDGGDESEQTTDLGLPNEEWSESEMLAREKAALGLFVTKHPLAGAAEMIDAIATATTADLQAYADGNKIILGGMVSSMRTVMTKQQKKMGIVNFEDTRGSVEVIVFPNDLPKFRHLLTPDSIIFVRGDVDKRREEPSVRVTEIIPAADAPRTLCGDIVLTVPNPDTATLNKLREIFRTHPGETPVYINLRSEGGFNIALRCGGALRVAFSAPFAAAIADLIGAPNVVVRSQSLRAIPWAKWSHDVAEEPVESHAAVA